MATGATYNDREFLFRLQTLIIDGGTVVIRTIFDQKLPNVPLNVFLANERSTINRLRRQKTITKPQYDQLNPQGGQLPNSADFDITLIICLLRNLPSLGLNQHYRWIVLPQPSDTSVEADLCRLRGFRNEVAHISSTVGIQQTYFQTKWTDIEQVLLRLNAAVPNPDPNLAQTFDSYKNSPFDPAAEKRIQVDISQWREMERGLDKDMQLMTKYVKEVKQDVRDMTKDVTNVTIKVKETNESVTEVKRDISDVKREITTVTEDIGEIRKDVKEVKGYVEEVKGHVKKVTEDVETVKLLLKEQTETKETNILKGKDLKDDLIEFYRRQHSTISLSPLIGEPIPLLEFYVRPDIKAIAVKRDRGGAKENKTLVAQFRNVFCKENKMCREIYLTADAGLGKTAFSKRLALTWCHAKKPLINENQYFSSQEIETINKFDLVFFVLLRESSSECDIDDLILNQIISKLARTYTPKDLENILFKETCLVILDGLDEWTHPPHPCKQGLSSIPHRKAREKCTVLTTTRPWKLSVSSLHSNQIDKKLEIAGLSLTAANALKRLVISHIFDEKDESKVKIYVNDFTSAMKDKRISDLEAIPLLLMYLLFLWNNGIDLGQSRCEVYSGIIELLLSRTASKFKNVSSKSEHAKGDILHCFSNRPYCRQFYTLLIDLGKLAFELLFRDSREENTFVFDSSVAEQYLTETSLTFCLCTGMITKSKVQGQLLEQKSKIAFAHKTVQEFFAVVYIYSSPDQTSVPAIVLSKCKCVKDILDKSNIFVFISGINVNVSSLISREQMKVINEDEITRKFRSTSHRYVYSHPLKEFQDMCISCCKEFPQDKEVNFCIQDVFIGGSCQQEQYRETLKHLTTRNKQNIRSLYIDMIDMRHTPNNSAQKVIEYFALHDLENIEKIEYIGEYNERDISPLLNRSIKSLNLSCFGRQQCSWSRLMYKKGKRLQKLEAMIISGLHLSHSELTLLLDYVSHRNYIREIELLNVRCTDHEDSCPGGRLDLSRHLQLRKLTTYASGLHTIPLSKLIINMASIEKCRLQNISNPDLVLRFVNCIPGDSKLDIFECRKLTSSVAIKTMLDTLHLLGHVKNVKLSWINLGNRKLTMSSEMVHIESVWLWRVTMPASVFRGLVDSVNKLTQTVVVDVQDCDITPKREFDTEIETIKASRHFRVLEDSEYVLGKRFEFETIKDGD